MNAVEKRSTIEKNEILSLAAKRSECGKYQVGEEF